VKALQADDLEIPGDPRVDFAGRLRLVLPHLRQRVQPIVLAARADDFTVVLGCRVDIVIVVIETRGS